MYCDYFYTLSELLIRQHLRNLDSPVLEETESFVGPDADEPLHRQSFKRPQGLEDAPHPAGHLSGGVDVVRLGVLGESLLLGKKKRIE